MLCCCILLFFLACQFPNNIKASNKGKELQQVLNNQTLLTLPLSRHIEFKEIILN